MNDKHTPGPWSVFTKNDGTMMVAKTPTHYIAKVVGSSAVGDVRAKFMADARLIAAAPDMLEALRMAAAAYAAGPNPAAVRAEMDSAIDYIRAAIAKATGG